MTSLQDHFGLSLSVANSTLWRLPEEFLDRRDITFAHITVTIRRPERNHAVHPVCLIGPKHAAIADSVEEVGKVPVKREAWDHRVEQAVCQRSFERGGDAPRCAVEPDFAESLVDRGGEQ